MSDLNKDIKIFFIDLDGTLLDAKKDGSHDISPDNHEALKLAKKQGKIIIISTGRSGVQASKYLELVDWDYAVTGNGAVILKNVHGNKVIKQTNMTIRQSLLIIDFAKKHGLVLKVDDKRIGYGSFGKFQSFITKKIRFQPVKHFNLEMHKEYYKIVLWGKTRSKMKKLGKLLSEKVEGVSVVSSSKGFTLEVTHKDSTKGIGNKYVAEQLGVTDKNHMIHIGDSMNDSTVVNYMGLIAMKNSPKELKNIATHIGPNYKKGGVAKVLAGQYKVNEKK